MPTWCSHNTTRSNCIFKCNIRKFDEFLMWCNEKSIFWSILINLKSYTTVPQSERTTEPLCPCTNATSESKQTWPISKRQTTCGKALLRLSSRWPTQALRSGCTRTNRIVITSWATWPFVCPIQLNLRITPLKIGCMAKNKVPIVTWGKVLED